jgi:hypothetical protein
LSFFRLTYELPRRRPQNILRGHAMVVDEGSAGFDKDQTALDGAYSFAIGRSSSASSGSVCCLHVVTQLVEHLDGDGDRDLRRGMSPWGLRASSRSGPTALSSGGLQGVG